MDVHMENLVLSMCARDEELEESWAGWDVGQ